MVAKECRRTEDTLNDTGSGIKTTGCFLEKSRRRALLIDNFRTVLHVGLEILWQGALSSSS